MTIDAYGKRIVNESFNEPFRPESFWEHFENGAKGAASSDATGHVEPSVTNVAPKSYYKDFTLSTEPVPARVTHVRGDAYDEACSASAPKPHAVCFTRAVLDELAWARTKHPAPFHSLAEAREVLREEFEEFVEKSRRGVQVTPLLGSPGNANTVARADAVAELVQLAAMCLRVAIEGYGFVEEQPL